jgi:hypothetical protein
LSKEKELEDWADMNNVKLTPEIYLSNQRSLIVQELQMIGVYLDMPGSFLESLNSRQFAEVLAGTIKRQRRKTND